MPVISSNKLVMDTNSEATVLKRVYLASYFGRRYELRGINPPRGIRIVSSWFWADADAFTEAERKEASVLCISEMAEADACILVLYPEDEIRGALIEAGACLGAGNPVIQVGSNSRVSPVMAGHPLWHNAPSVEEAFKKVLSL